MKNIKFIDRTEEIKRLKEIEKSNFFLVVKGRRRIGKTLLLKKAFPDAAYIFIWPDKSIEWVTEQICLEQKIPQFKKFTDILEYFLDANKIVIIDEFQNLLNVDKSVYGEIQKMLDGRKISKKSFRIAVAGSSYSLMNKVFNVPVSPLYGRRTEEIALGNLPIKELFEELGCSLENFVKLWAVFEGAPYYYELINPKLSAEEVIKRLVISKEAQLQNEGSILLSVEFGKDSKTYNTVITGIAEGKTKLNEIASLFSNKKNEVIKYLDILRNDFHLVRKITPITDEPKKSRDGKYEIIDNFLSFWFYFIDKNKSYIEQERFMEVERYFAENFKGFVGRRFEEFVQSIIKAKIIFSHFNFSLIGRQWGKKQEKETYEIDILALNEKSNEALLAECKWKEKINAEQIVSEIIEKEPYIRWPKNKDGRERKESYAVFAKSFKKKITEFEGKKVYCFDLKDIEDAIRKGKI